MVGPNLGRPGPGSTPTQESTYLPVLSASASLVLVIILPVFAIAPLFYPGYFQTLSGFIPLWNVADLRANLGSPNWTPNIATDFDFVRSTGLLPYYLASLLPAAPIIAVKIVIGFGWLLGGLGLFLWLKAWLGNAGALVAALVYVYLPYQIATVYVRGAWGETLFWGLLPWAMLVTARIAVSPRFWLIAVGTALWLSLGITQLGLAFWALIFAAVYSIGVCRPARLAAIVPVVVGTGLATATYLLWPPNVSRVPARLNFSDHFLFPFQLVSAAWGFGPSLPGWQDTLPLQLGLAALGLAILGLFLWQRGGSGQVSRTDRRLLFFSLAALMLVLLQFGPSSILWNLPLLPGRVLSDSLTYPWQLLGLIGLCLAVMAGATLWLDRQLARLPLFGAIILITILSVYPFLSPRFIRPDVSVPETPQAEFGESQLTLVNHEFAAKTSGHTVGLQFGQTAIPLAGHGPLEAGDTLLLNVSWHPLQSFGEDLKIFVHLVDTNDRILAQFDGQPLAGEYPTSDWLPGEIIPDTYAVKLPLDAPPGPYRVYLGLYDAVTNNRLPVTGSDAGRAVIDVK